MCKQDLQGITRNSKFKAAAILKIAFKEILRSLSQCVIPLRETSQYA